MLKVLSIALLLVTSVPALAGALELLFVDSVGCPWCARFEREIAPIYPRTEVGKAVPMRRASLNRGQPPGVVLRQPVQVTPTFVLLSDGKEVARIVGYRDDASFWGLFEKAVGEHRSTQGE